jgi:FkbM family methyltransferase
VISYAQNGEDVVLARLFDRRVDGRYVDVGAGDPVRDSVTMHFYEAGWSGINIEPAPALAASLRERRPRDLTIEAVVAAVEGTARLHVATEERWGWSTARADLAEKYLHDGLISSVVEVPAITLADAFARCDGPIDFVKIDVEGMEGDVIAGGQWMSYQPRVVLVEATNPGTTIRSEADWEPVLTEAGYHCVLFDGLNRFYARRDDDEAAELLAAPANVLDGATPYPVIREREERAATERELFDRVESLAAELSAASEYAQRLQNEVARQAAGQAEAAHYAERLRQRIDELEHEAIRSGDYAARLENELQRVRSRQSSADSLGGS